jgi:hypothetical protein
MVQRRLLEYEAEGRAVHEKTARLTALRLAAEAGNKDAAIRAAPNPTKKRPPGSRVLLHNFDAAAWSQAGASA